MNIVNVGYDSANYYVIDSGTQRLLIDVGWPGTLPKLLANLKRMDVDLSKIGYLLVTHFHPDHAGLVQDLKGLGVRFVLPEVQILAIHLLKTYMSPGLPFKEIILADNLRLLIAESRLFLKQIGISGTILSTPGHSDDSITLVLDDGTAFTGDLLPPTLVDTNIRDTVTRSWNAIRSLNARMIYPGHGPVRPLPPEADWMVES
jgi:endoribonuclease LACTB2